MKPEDFLEYTPQELSAILFYNAEEQQERVKIEWEKTRIQTFFLLSVHIPKKHSFNYEKFKKEWVFAWEVEKKQKTKPGEGVMTPEQWASILKHK